MENTVTMRLSDYDKLKTDNYLLKEELRHARNEVSKMNDIKILLMEELVDEYRVEKYSLENITDINKWEFALKKSDKLLKFGFELQEMIEFIKYKYEQYHKETEVSEDE